jgi:hypothetical protein
MADEAVIVELHGQPKGGTVRYNCADATAIAKGTLCVLSGSRICAPSANAAQEQFIGVAATEKEASDGQTTLGLNTKGIYDMKVNTSGASVTEGDAVTLSGINMIHSAIWDKVSGAQAKEIMGLALETGTVGHLLGLRVLVSNNVTADYAAVVIGKEACTWKNASPLKTKIIEDFGIGYTIRSWEVGVAQLKNPKAVCLIINTAK